MGLFAIRSEGNNVPHYITFLSIVAVLLLRELYISTAITTNECIVDIGIWADGPLKRLKREKQLTKEVV